jgi:hypothetical protein
MMATFPEVPNGGAVPGAARFLMLIFDRKSTVSGSHKEETRFL